MRLSGAEITSKTLWLILPLLAVGVLSLETRAAESKRSVTKLDPPLNQTISQDARLEMLKTDVVRSVKTDTTGQYQVVGLSAGSYRITATKEGFNTVELPGVMLVVGQNG